MTFRVILANTKQHRMTFRVTLANTEQHRMTLGKLLKTHEPTTALSDANTIHIKTAKNPVYIDN